MLPRLDGVVRTTPWEKRFRLYLVSRGLSTAGSNIAAVLLAFAVLTVDGTARDVAAILAASMLTQALLLPVGGVLADRLPRRLLAFGGYLIQGAPQVVLGAILVVTPEVVAPWHFLAAGCVTAAGMALTQPVLQGILVDIVPGQHFQAANAKLRLVLNVARIALPGLGASIAAVGSVGAVLTLSGCCVLGASALLGTIAPDGRSEHVPMSPLRSAAEGLGAVWRRPWLRAYVVSAAVTVPFWLAGYQLLGPVMQADEPLGVARWGWAVSTFAVGMLLGSLAGMRWKPKRLMLSAVVSQSLWPLPLLALATDVPLWLLLLAMLASGIGADLTVVLFETAKQQAIPSQLFGRVSSVDLTAQLVLVPVGYVLAGSLVDVLGIHNVMWLCFAGLLVATVAMLAVRDVRQFARVPDEPLKPEAISETGSSQMRV